MYDKILALQHCRSANRHRHFLETLCSLFCCTVLSVAIARGPCVWLISRALSFAKARSCNTAASNSAWFPETSADLYLRIADSQCSQNPVPGFFPALSQGHISEYMEDSLCLSHIVFGYLPIPVLLQFHFVKVGSPPKIFGEKLRRII